MTSSLLRSPAAPSTGLRPALLRRGPVIPAYALTILVALFIMAADNRSFWARAGAIFDNPVSVMQFGAALFALTLFLLSAFGPGRLQKPVLVFLLMLSAVTSYYMDSLGVMIDRDMIQNAMTTTFNESRHLITPGFLLHVALFGLLPSLAVLWLRVRPRRFLRRLLGWGGMVLASLALFAGLILSDFKTFSAVLREHKELVGSYQPGAPLGGAVHYAKMMLKSRDVTVAPLGADAVKGPRLAAVKKPVLTVLVVGETARAQNFGLNGYARDTTPELAARGVMAFQDVESCGTATAVSMPCMFSALGREGYSYDKGIRQENLLDVLQHAGVAVEWWDNNTGDKGLAARIGKARSMDEPGHPAFCGSGECTDGIFLGALGEAVAGMTEDTVLVLHQIGSHGPAYHMRYPPEFERFTPACQTAEFAECSVEEIRNAYDNTILYTDHVLASAIDLLAAQDRVIPALLYISDHGESLGEDGLYLHGAPRFMAPETQTRVPMVLWLSEAYRRSFGVDPDCVAARGKGLSHDNLFPSVLGLMDITTSARREDLDLFAPCHIEAS